MIIKTFEKKGLLESNVLLKGVKIVWCSIAKPNMESEYPTNKYEATIVFDKKSEKLNKLKELCNTISKNNNEVENIFKFKIKTQQQIEDFNKKVEAEIDEGKKNYMIETLQDYLNCEFLKVDSQFEIKVIDITGKPVEDLEEVIFNNQTVNIQIKLNNPLGLNKYKKYSVGQFLTGIQLLEVKRKNSDGLMFELEKQDNEDLPF